MPLLPRREFVRQSAGFLALSVLPSPLRAMSSPAAAPDLTGRPMPELYRPMPDPPTERVGFALVGLGAFALNEIAPHLPTTRHARLAALVSGNAEKRDRVGEAYGVAPEHRYSYETFDRIADDDAVDVVYIITPNAFHRELTERAFAAGKHVMCEKPMAPTVEDCEAMIAAGERAGKRLMIAYRAQYDPYNLRAIDLVQGGEIGDVGVIVADHQRILDLSDVRDQWRAKQELAGGGSLFDIGIYSVNGARYLTGEEPVEVSATYLERSDRPEVTVEEGIEWQMTFPSGARALCSSSYLVAGNKRIHVQGSEGEVTLDPATDYYIKNLTVKKGDETRQIVIPAFDQPGGSQFAGELDEMALAVLENREPKTGGAEGLQDVRVMRAIYDAADSGRAVAL